MTGFCAGRMVRDGPVPVLRGIPPTMPPRSWGRQAGRSRSAGVRGTPVIGGRPANCPCTGDPDGTEERDPGVPPVTGGRPTVGPCPSAALPPAGGATGGRTDGCTAGGTPRPGGTLRPGALGGGALGTSGFGDKALGSPLLSASGGTALNPPATWPFTGLVRGGVVESSDTDTWSSGSMSVTGACALPGEPVETRGGESPAGPASPGTEIRCAVSSCEGDPSEGKYPP